MITVICEYAECGKEFKQTRDRKRFCSRKCVGLSQRKAEHYSICKRCGGQFHRRPGGRSSGKNSNSYCSKECYGMAISKSEHNTKKRMNSLIALSRLLGRTIIKYLDPIHSLIELSKRLEIAIPNRSNTCSQCQKQFFSRAPKQTCSAECYRKTDSYKNYINSPERLASRKAWKVKDKALRRNAAKAESIDVFEIFKLFKWRCYWCGISTPKKLRGKNADNSPELDHITPLAKGGAHTKNNVVCSCRKCNIMKSDQYYLLI